MDAPASKRLHTRSLVAPYGAPGYNRDAGFHRKLGGELSECDAIWRRSPRTDDCDSWTLQGFRVSKHIQSLWGVG